LNEQQPHADRRTTADDLDDFQKVSAVFYRPPPHGTELELTTGLSLVYNEDAHAWIVRREDGGVADILNPGQWRSARRLYAYLSELPDGIDGGDVDGEPWRWSH